MKITTTIELEPHVYLGPDYGTYRIQVEIPELNVGPDVMRGPFELVKGDGEVNAIESLARGVRDAQWQATAYFLNRSVELLDAAKK